ncbi:cation:proton antiporter [Streptomyces tricolor]|nr:cation:proton antiporter [Streptomyces tricolor]
MILSAGVVDDIVGWFPAVRGLRDGHRRTHRGRHGDRRPLPGRCGAFALLIGRPLVGAALSRAGRAEGATPTIMTAVVLVLFGAAATQAMELEAIFGAFVVGVLVGTSKDLDREKLEPLKTTALAFLAPLFFATAGRAWTSPACATPTGPRRGPRRARRRRPRQVRRRLPRRPVQPAQPLGGARPRRRHELPGRGRGRRGDDRPTPRRPGHRRVHHHRPRRDRDLADDAARPAGRDDPRGGTRRRRTHPEGRRLRHRPRPARLQTPRPVEQ